MRVLLTIVTVITAYGLVASTKTYRSATREPFLDALLIVDLLPRIPQDLFSQVCHLIDGAA